MSRVRIAPRKKEGRRGAGRRLAEGVTLVVSALLLLGLVGYLLVEAQQPHSPYVVIEARPLTGQIRREGGWYIVPVEVVNESRRAVRELKVEMRLGPPGGGTEAREIQVEFLAGRSRQTVYLYAVRDPRGRPVQVWPLQYRLD